ERADTVAAVELRALESEALGAIAAARDATELDEARVRYLGRKSQLKLALREVRDRESGLALNELRETIESAVAAREDELERAELERALAEERVDVTVPGERPRRGRLHLITQIRREVEDIFLGLGYEVFDDREVETVEDNFTALNFPAWHPARSPRDSLYLNGDVLLRTEPYPSQVQVLRRQRTPIYLA